MQFDLDPEVVHLNHGAFGAAPRVVGEAGSRWRAAAEANPYRFHRAVVPGAVVEARAAAAAFLHVGADDIGLVRNVSEGVATVLAALDLRPGDEVVHSDHAHGGVRLSLEAACRRAGARAVLVDVPLPAAGAEVVEAFADAVTRRTRLVLLDHITSVSASLLPVAEVARAVKAAAPDALVLVDAAHVPGHVDVDPSTLGADFWTGNLYKWAFTPRGSGVVWVAAQHRDSLVPLVPSWGADEPFPAPWDHPGSQDWASWLSIPAALEFFGEIGGWERVRRSSELVQAGQAHVAEALGTDLTGLPGCPAPCMRLVRLPDGVVEGPGDVRELYLRLSTEFAVEAGPVWFKGEGLVRFSGQVYNDPGDYERLADALVTACA